MRKRFLCLGMSLLIALTCFGTPLAAFADSENGSDEDLSDTVQEIVDSQSSSLESDSYYDYYNYYQSANSYKGYVSAKFKSAEKAKSGTYDKRKAYVLDSSNNWVEYTFTVPEDGKYGITLDYYQLPNKEKDIEVTVNIDGKLPYAEAQQIALPRIWEDDIDAENVPEGAYFECTDKDGMADDIRPSQKEMAKWTTRSLINIRGLYNEPYQFYLTQGKHTVRFILEREAVAIANVRIGNDFEPVTYDEYIAGYSESDQVKNNGVKYGENGDLSVVVQAEQTYYKNNIVLYPTYDNSGASTQPNDPAYTKLNTIGQANWTTNGDEIVWQVNAKKAGLYKLVFRARQNFNEGMYSYRILKINGEIPFKEAEQIGFKYKQGWYMLTLGSEDKDYYVYLNEGINTVSMTCTTGELSAVLRSVQQSVLDLNEIYREIISVTSTEPDIYRDYTLEQQLPNLCDDLDKAKADIDATSKLVQSITGTAGSQASSLDYVSQIIGDLAEDPYEIPQRLSSFKDGIETLGSLVSTLSKLALEIDYLVFLPTDVETPSVSDGFFNTVSYTWKQFISSFTVDYNVTTSDSEATSEDAQVVKVWVSTGRDQAKIISGLISDNADKLVTVDGKPISIQLSMVNTGQTLIRATLAGKGPDCALMIGEDTPINLAARGALIPLTNYKSELEDQFHKSAWIPFYYNGEYYALPETQSFELMYYRTDVFKQYGLGIPKTWDEFYNVMEILQNANLKIGILEINSANAGISAGLGTFDKFLVQNGGTYYTDNLDATRFTDEVAYSAFETWVELYSKYGLDRSFDFYSRFRTGEMPLGLTSYTTYNQIKSAAPELNGLWSFAEIPGTVQEDGTINNSETSVVTGCIMLKSAREKGIEEAASTFLKWWVSSETQAEYARELEATLGVAARYAPANTKAFETLGWTIEESEVIKNQWKSVTVMNEVPGNYVLKRALTSAFRSVVNGDNSARRALTIYNKDINDEITRKRKEFGLE